MAKNKVKVNIASKPYTIIGDDPAEHMIAVGQIVDTHVRDIADNYPALSVADRTVLAAINVADEYVKTREKLMKMIEELTQSEQLLIQRLEDLTADVNLLKASVEEAERRAEEAEARAEEAASQPQPGSESLAEETEFDMDDANAFLRELGAESEAAVEEGDAPKASEHAPDGLMMGPDEDFGAAPAETETAREADRWTEDGDFDAEKTETEMDDFPTSDDFESVTGADSVLDWDAPEPEEEADEDSEENFEAESEAEPEPEKDDEEEPVRSVLFDDEDFIQPRRLELDSWDNPTIDEGVKEADESAQDAWDESDADEAEDVKSDIPVDDYEDDEAAEEPTEFVFGGQTAFDFGDEPEKDDEDDDYPDTSMLDKPDFGQRDDED